MRRKIYATNIHEEKPSDYLISCLQDGVVSMKTVLSEFISRTSEDDIKEIIFALDLGQEYSDDYQG